jgi:hypothetical protein
VRGETRVARVSDAWLLKAGYDPAAWLQAQAPAAKSNGLDDASKPLI